MSLLVGLEAGSIVSWWATVVAQRLSKGAWKAGLVVAAAACAACPALGQDTARPSPADLSVVGSLPGSMDMVVSINDLFDKIRA